MFIHVELHTTPLCANVFFFLCSIKMFPKFTLTVVSTLNLLSQLDISFKIILV
jgi:hypothetical protein